MSRTVVTSPAIPLTHLSIAHSGPAAAVRLRTGTGWSDWLELNACQNGRDGHPGSTRSSIVVANGATGYEVQVGDGSDATVAELNMVDGARRTIANPETNSLPLSRGGRQPTYLPRSRWGADESLRFADNGSELWPGEFFPVQTLTVHHSGVYEHNEDPDPAATVRAIYYDQCVLQEFGDIGYHLLIDEAGRIYEGRYSDAGSLPVYGPGLGSDGRPLMVNAAHVGGYNAGNIGICLLGRFTSRQPSAAAHRSLVFVLDGLSSTGRLNPTGQTNYVNPVSGVGGRVNVISGHRDWASVGADPTECPGDAFHPYLGKLRQEVAALQSEYPAPPPRRPTR
ncbi:N-acetylmuramoyl-L-alanine amidase [Micromonospora sp. STR1_7]|uniref:N-acetylmuramoyl-L-alanine amidase n=1 Tax=Micromonospora parastrephiae TaxID=2806101 RepID=A0ABS1XTE7_9ACTN|nr:peptidoglycan recognition family protein [Micromonospora parastrephiae]MBM0232526.1 N-acetylmuramoyl-L-alanine amidase [Micromonospora parastrephiae]